MQCYLPRCLFLQSKIEMMNKTTTSTPRQAPTEPQTLALYVWVVKAVEIAACRWAVPFLIRSPTTTRLTSAFCFPSKNKTKILNDFGERVGGSFHMTNELSFFVSVFMN